MLRRAFLWISSDLWIAKRMLSGATSDNAAGKFSSKTQDDHIKRTAAHARHQVIFSSTSFTG